MITGFNTDIENQGQLFHVQTEDKGVANPIIETLVYAGGQIVCARKTSYAELAARGELSEDVIHSRMEAQHRELIREIRDSTLSKEDLEPFGCKFISNRSFDEVVRAFLSDQVPLERIRLDLDGSDELQAGQRPTLTLRVVDETSERPVCGARVVVSLVARGKEGKQLLAAVTDEVGRVEAACDIPAAPGTHATLVCAAEAAGATAEVRRRVKRGPRVSVQGA